VNVDFFNVVVGLFFNKQGQILAGKRQKHQIYADFWEFPGGKVEDNEELISALKREMAEELDVEVLKAKCILCVPFEYPDRMVHLHVFLIEKYSNTAKGNEGQIIEWLNVNEITTRKSLEANIPIINAIHDLFIN
jgi:8-oxo-dGTP diphosphatase